MPQGQEVSFRPEQVTPAGAGEVSFAPGQITPMAAHTSAAAPPPAPGSSSIFDRRNWPSPWEAVKGAGRSLLNAGDLGMAESTPNQKVISGENAAGMVGGALATGAVAAAAPEVAGVAGLAGVAKALPWAWRAGSALAGVAGAGAAGGAAGVAEGKPLTGEDSALKAAEWQAGLQAAGLPVGWLINAAGRRIMATTVGKQALEWLGTARGRHVEEAQQVLTTAQDALDVHAKRQALARVAEVDQQQALARAGEQATVAGDTRTAALKAQWPSAESAPPRPGVVGPAATAPLQPVPAHQSLEAALRAGEADLHIQGTAPPNPDRGPGGLTLRPPAPQNAQSISAAMDRRDALLGRTETSAAVPPPGPLYMSGRRSGPPSPAMAEQLAFAEQRAATPPPMAPAHAPTPVGQPSYASQATQQVADVVAGPAQTSKERLGAAVEAAAETGPQVPWTPIRNRVEAMYAKTQPAAISAPAGGEIPADIQGYLSNQTPQQIRAFMEKAGIPLEEAHPLPGVLAKLQEVPTESISFADAHKFKRLLDDAIGWKPAGAVQAPARGQLKQVTKGIRKEIRTAMSGHQPYEQATAGYSAASKLFGEKGLARKIQAAAEANPDALVNALVKVNEPERLRMLREVLLHHAEQGGGEVGAAQGQNAWAAVQSTVMYQHLIKPGIDQWEKSLAKLHPEFLQTLTQEPYAKAVFTRLQTLAQAVKASEAQAAAESRVIASQQASHTAGSATRKAEAGVEGLGLRRTRLEAARGVQEARRSPLTPRPGEDFIGRQLTNQEEAFRKSSLGNPASTTQQISDLTYAATAPPGSPRQMAGMARLLWRGPKANDLIHWASLSDQNTQMVVHALSGQNSAQAVSALMRGVEELYRQHRGEPRMAVGHQQGGAASPPPAPPR